MRSAAESNVFSRNYSLNINGRLLDLRTPKVMGVLNITPDSFYGRSRFQSEEKIIEEAGKMLEAGADILDVGGHSTRPGAADVPESEETSRVVMAVKAIIRHFPQAIISCDSFKSGVAAAAVSEGALLINDVSAGTLDEKMAETVARLKVPYIAMHMRGTPATMNQQTDYENLHFEIISWLQNRVTKLMELGIKDIVVDPGFGFAKSIEQNFRLMKRLELFHYLDRPLLIGISRKSMIWKTLGIAAEQALNGTSVLNTIALMKGAAILRVHDVPEAVQAVKLYMTYESAS
jgi:dihydropteroate synthase